MAMAASIPQPPVWATARLPGATKLRRSAIASRRHSLLVVGAATSEVSVNCGETRAAAAREKISGSSYSGSSSPPLWQSRSLLLGFDFVTEDSAIHGGSNGVCRTSRRKALLDGVAVLAGSGGMNLLHSPAIGATEAKQTNLSIDDVKKIVEADIIERQYPVTGNLTESIYDENCRFQDPTIDIQGVKKYAAALQLLFEPETSKHEILYIAVTGPRTIQVDWRLRGYMKLPWRPYIPPYEGTTTYATDENGLIVSHSETWKISPLTAFIQALTPSFFSKDAPP